MRVKLSNRAIDELKLFSKVSGGTSSVKLIPSLGWRIDCVYRDKTGKIIKELGPGFDLGALPVDGEFGGYKLVKQNGLEFFLMLPLEVSSMENLYIDYDGKSFILI